MPLLVAPAFADRPPQPMLLLGVGDGITRLVGIEGRKQHTRLQLEVRETAKTPGCCSRQIARHAPWPYCAASTNACRPAFPTGFFDRSWPGPWRRGIQLLRNTDIRAGLNSGRTYSTPDGTWSAR